jgi:GDSL-like Lipase/Acylhydrolase family
MSRAGRILVINVLALSLIPVCLELALHIVDPSARLPPNGYVGGIPYTWGREVKLNSWAFREREFSGGKTKGAFRIMVLGDSLTWGIGLPAARRYTELLENMLNDQRPDMKWEVLNFGFDGLDTTRQAEILHDIGLFVAPDLIVVGFCFNDVTARAQEYSPERENFPHQHPVVDKMELFFTRVGFPLLGKHLKKSAYRWAELTGAIPEWPESLDRAYQPDSAEWKSFDAGLASISRNAVKLTGRRPIFIVLNQVLDKSTREKSPQELNGKFHRWHEQALTAAVDAGFVASDCGELIPMDQPLSWYVVNAADNHPSATMNEIYAKRLFQMIMMHPDISFVQDRVGISP